jgi:malonyl-CoA/methylmalonyl-CoA synthetase
VDAHTLTALFRAGRPADGSTLLLDIPGGEGVTYDDADRRGAQLANALVACGVRPGDRVVAQMEKSPNLLLLYLACLRVGAVFLPLNTAYSDPEVAYLLGDAEPVVAVCDPSRVGAYRSSPGLRVLTADDHGAGTLSDVASAEGDSFDDVEVVATDPAALLYTSGTTGRPKGAPLSHGNLAANAAALHQAWGFGPDDVLLHALPLYHAHGLFVAAHCVLANGTPMVFLPRFDVAAVIDQLTRCTVFMGVPTYYTRLLGDPRLDRRRCRHLRLFVSGSAPLLASTHHLFEQQTGHAIIERYGMTETLMIASNPLKGPRRAGTVGPALPGMTVRIVDQSTRRVNSAGAVGEIEVKGPSVFAGYWHAPAESGFTTDGFFRTGDLGLLDEDGYLHIVGRAKDLIISGGLNVYPKEVESVLDELDGVLESAVIGLPDDDLGERVVAVVVGRADHALDESTLRSSARLALAPFKLPKQIHVIDELPRNAMGKVDKAGLRRRFSPPGPDPTN